MADTRDFQRLDQAIDALLAGRAGQKEGDLSSLLSVAAGLQFSPRPAFRASLRTQLRRIAMSSAPAVTTQERQSAIPYLIVQNASALIDFLKEVFGAEELIRVPMENGLLMHAAVRIDDSYIELADSNEQFPPRPTALHVYVPNVDEVVARAVSAGGEQRYPVTDQEYGDREAGVRDPFGNNWYIATHLGGSHRPEGLRTVSVYLHPVGGPEFLEFVQKAFGAVPKDVHTAEGRIVHGKFALGNTTIEFSDAHGGWGPFPTGIHLYVDDCDAAYARAIAAGAHAVRQPEDQPYGERIATVRDPFWNDWFLATPIP